MLKGWPILTVVKQRSALQTHIIIDHKAIISQRVHIVPRLDRFKVQPLLGSACRRSFWQSIFQFSFPPRDFSPF